MRKSSIFRIIFSFLFILVLIFPISDNAYYLNKVEASNSLYYYDKFSVNEYWVDTSEWVLVNDDGYIGSDTYWNNGYRDVCEYRSSWTFNSETNTYLTTGSRNRCDSWGTIYTIRSYGELFRFSVRRSVSRDTSEYYEYSYYGAIYKKSPTNNRKFEEKGVLVTQDIIAKNGTYPQDGVHSDGYWYVRKGQVNNAPTLVLNTSNNQILSEVNGFNLLNIHGTVKDTDVGDILSVKYTIDGNTSHTNKTIATITANGSDQAFNVPITINNTIPQGSHTLKVWVEDNKGGKSVEQTRSFRVDKTAPSTPTFSTNENWTNQNVPVNIVHGSDSGGAGVARTEYQLSGATSKDWTTYSGSFDIVNEGVTTITARTVDAVGNTSTTKTATVRIDKTKPNINVAPVSRETWDTTEINISVDLEDSLSGIDSRQYEISNSPIPSNTWTTAPTNAFTLKINTEGEWHLHVRATDAAGNAETQTFGVYRYFVLEQAQGIKAVNPTNNQLEIEWNKLDNYEYQVRLVEEQGKEVYTSDWKTSPPVKVDGLQPNSKYTPEVNARRNEKETGFVTGTPEYTDANPVKKATFEAQDRAIEVRLDTSSTGNPPGTTYIIKNMGTNQVSPEVEESWVNADLLNDMTYTYMARVVNRNGKDSEWFLIGIGHTQMTEIDVPGDWDDPVGGENPIQIPGDYDPDDMPGKVVEFEGELAIVVKGRYIDLEIKNVENASHFAIALEGFGYSDWKELDSTGSFKESIFINHPGLYKVHVKFKNEFGGESKAYVRNFLVDWIAPDITTKKKNDRQTASTNGTFAIQGKGKDNLTPVLYNTGSGWHIYEEGKDLIFSNLSPGYNKVKVKFGDYNGNVTEVEYEVWGL